MCKPCYFCRGLECGKYFLAGNETKTVIFNKFERNVMQCLAGVCEQDGLNIVS